MKEKVSIKMSDNIVLNLEGVPCPQNTARVMLKLNTMEQNEVLEVIIDDGEPVNNLVSSLEDSGFIIIFKNKIMALLWLLKIKVE